MAFNVGDKVQHKSGTGPKMVVEEVSPDEVSCSWFANNVKKVESFNPATIEAVPPTAVASLKLSRR